MRRFTLSTLAALLLAIYATAGWAASLSDPDYRAKVASQFHGVSAQDITPAKIEGFWKIVHNGVVGYLTANGRYYFSGDLIDLKRGTNLSAQTRRHWRAQQIAQVPESRMLIYAPPDPDYTVTVFTDVDCFYCRQLHHELGKLLDAGIRVRYMFLPLRGPGSTSFRQAKLIWCADDRHAAMNAAMQGETLSGQVDCDTPVPEQYKLAVRTLGLRGAPSIITADGHVLHGGIPASKIIKRVQHAAQG